MLTDSPSPQEPANESKAYLPRYVDVELEDLLTHLPAAAIDGPKGVGKTETASRHVDRVLRLDVPDTRDLVATDTCSQLLSASRLCVDEWQKHPPVWDAVRRLVDESVPNRFILTGSASPTTSSDPHSGAGRIVSLRMRPLSLAERADTSPSIRLADLFSATATISGTCTLTAADYARQICASGFPAITSLAPRWRRTALEGYVTRIIDHDLPELGTTVRHPAAMRAWMRAYAAASSTTATYSAILDAATPSEAAKPSRITTNTYRELLSALWILDPVPAWVPAFTPLTRLTKGDKHQLCDPGLAACLVGASEEVLLSGRAGTGEVFGRLFESLATLSLRAAAPSCEAQVFHLRTRGGEHEVDLIVEHYDGQVIACEVKLARTVDDHDVRHLNWLKEELGERLVERIVINTGPGAYRRPDGVAVIPLGMLA